MPNRNRTIRNMVFEGGRGGYQTVQMLGMINALKTGDQMTDTLIAMFLPLVLSKLAGEVGRLGKELWMRRYKVLFRRTYKRTIAHKSGGRTSQPTNNSMTTDEDSYNCFLIKAIKLYMHKHCKFNTDDVDLELIEPDVLDVNNKGATDTRRQRKAMMMQAKRHGFPTSVFGGGGAGGLMANSTSTYGMLQNCSIIQRPVKQRWHDVGVFDGSPVKIYMAESVETGVNAKRNNDDGSDPTPSQTLELRLESEGANSIDEFVGKAYDWYLGELRKNENNDRFLFDLRAFDGRSSHRTAIYARYKLGDEKTFASLFSKQCHSLLDVVDQFQNKEGKYAVPGYPYKLGLLLHGPPGSGKTSFIKALAHHTDRHIVNVPLARIQTNQELMTLMFNDKFTTPGDPKPATLGFDQVIYVFEDIDAASDVVMRRDAKKGKKSVPLPDPATGGLSSGGRSGFSLDGDELNLTGVLNALDGVVDTPGRIVIMTTNHPEMLDPALIRPGRIDKKLELSHMHEDDVIAMIEHYYQTNLTDSEKRRVYTAVLGEEDEEPLKLVPAHVEQRSMDEGTVDAMIEFLEKERAKVSGNVKDGDSMNSEDVKITDAEESSTADSSSESS